MSDMPKEYAACYLAHLSTDRYLAGITERNRTVP
ncbi:hypothetical protein EGR_08795 [Echinococcus granulosus]|uniref:Uncharacterized protein n=1 Tax=Echinococcus granulosus TaxID=6210 RepID=W6USF2_ECHGR|nr:hypothetical protein EGR_08795 [Echinococcus granulosus]EUB56369.1 hypothetical protein EGR_08795 [Echinococcus granulosus]